MSYQKVIVVGNCGADCALRYLSDGTAVASFSLAVNEKYKEKETTIWYKVTTWRKTAEICAEYVKKGREYLVEGRMTPDKTTGGPRTWQAQDGSWRASYEMTADRVVFLQGGSDNSGASKPSVDDEEPNVFDVDALPF